MRVQITDVFLRDGLQDEDVQVSIDDRVRVGRSIAAAGIDRFEVGSFVSPRRVPQMVGTGEVLNGLRETTTAQLTVLALNRRGIRSAVEAGATDVQIVVSASQAHSGANAGRSVEESLAQLAAEVKRHPGTRFFAGISTAFTCPFEGHVEVRRLVELVRAFRSMGVEHIGLADTLGTTEPERLQASLAEVMAHEPDPTYYLHLHDAHGRALESVDLALEAGIQRFDAALGGFGGCPFAPGAHGNLATEDLVRHLHAAGFETGVNEALLDAAVREARTVVAQSPPVEQQVQAQ